MARHTFFCIDGHTCGNPVRVVGGGSIPQLNGDTMFDRRQHFLADDVSGPAGNHQGEAVPGDSVNQVVVVELDHRQTAHRSIWSLGPSIGISPGVDEIRGDVR